MKRGTTPTLKVKIGVKNSDVATIDFIFRQEANEDCTTSLSKQYPTDVTYDSSEDVYLISFTASETRTFQANSLFYMDTRVNFSNGKIPDTSIITLRMNQTLFKTDNEEDDDD